MEIPVNSNGNVIKFPETSKLTKEIMQDLLDRLGAEGIALAVFKKNEVEVGTLGLSKKDLEELQNFTLQLFGLED